MVKPITTAVGKLPRKHKITISGISAFLLVLLIWPSEQASASRNTEAAEQFELGKRYPLPLALQNDSLPEVTEAEPEWVQHTVRSGDNLAVIFQQLGLSAQQLYRVTQAPDANILRRIHPGDTLYVAKEENNDIIELRYALNEIETFVIYKDAESNTYLSKRETKEVEARLAFAHATITSNFWNAGVQAGLTQAQIMNLAELFGWDVDFALDIRQGDSFSVLYEQKFIDGEYVGTGDIIAAEFINQREKFQAVKHENGNYYTPEGKNMRKTFLRSPVHFTRVSSDFNPRRMHPVTGRVAPHNGIDYAAPTGTPVMSAGDGRVIASAYNNLNGHYIFVQHGERYVTKYLHLSRRHVSQGERVRQGEVIGRVGATGRVTGAHLHYEFLVDGAHRNPRTVKLPQAESLPANELPSFQARAQQQMAMIESRQRVYLAMNYGND
ncbi:peptidoglycan DD-metalloendopeptidase family protein [Aliidiomarina celeris]|uniref:peptidoglycan DD-metalloendopeptidase family protein n=1 Tax=Aliidiomarina celeris TaxID=2249428 RepID=UPI000DE8AA13|nr:peptidoglycan DD-metalloendopeptidase family protein [Aliidiomarina celeris]